MIYDFAVIGGAIKKEKKKKDPETAGEKTSGLPPVYFQMGIRCHTSRSWKIKIPGRILPCITRRIIR